LLDSEALRRGADCDAFVLEDRVHGVGYVLVLARDEARRHLYDHHLAAKAPVHLRKLDVCDVLSDDRVLPRLDTLHIDSYGPSMTTPNCAAPRATCVARALAINVLVGTHPLLTHVPPKRLRSMTATRCPAPAKRTARAGPA